MILRLIIVALFIASCSNGIDPSFLNEQLDKALANTQNEIKTHRNVIEKAHAVELAMHTNKIYERFVRSSKMVDDVTKPILNSTQGFNQKYDEIIARYSNHIELMEGILNNDGLIENDYIVEANHNMFNGTMVWHEEAYDRFMDRALKGKTEAESKIQLKTIYLQLKNSERQTYGYIRQYIDGQGIVFNKVKGHIYLESQNIALGDSLVGRIICDATRKNDPPKFYIGTIDTAKFGNREVMGFGAGYPFEVPIVGEYQEIHQSEDGNFHLAANKLGKSKIEGVIEIKSPRGTFYTPFKKEFKVHKQIPNYLLDQ